MQSSFYRPRKGHGPPAWEWYRPAASEVAKMSRGMRQHVDMGGLDIRARAEGKVAS